MKIISIFKQIKRGELPNFTYMFKRILEYADRYSKLYNVSKIYLFIDYFWCALIYGCDGIDYFQNKLFLLKRCGKKKFLTLAYEVGFEEKHTNTKLSTIIDDKEKSLLFFADYMKRDWCGPNNHNSNEDFDAFYEKHDKAIIKPLNGSGGHGVELVELDKKFGSGNELKKYCLKNNRLVEEVIPQHEVLNRMYPQAINTVRIVTLKGKCLCSVLRMGVGDSHVDNAHSNGIYAEIDIDEGVIFGQAMRYTEERFTCHPTTGTVIPGFRIPFWNESKALVEKASKLVTEVYLVGWDVAITPDGPTLVEVNTHPGFEVHQGPRCCGMKHEFEKIKD